MRILLIRHGDPDYENDSLTEKGRREAECLAELLCGEDLTYIYTSPCGRAKDTAAYTLDRLGRTAEVLPWLKEVESRIIRPDSPKENIPWDWLPQDWTREPLFYDRDRWADDERMRAGKAGDEYRRVTEAFDALLARHGYCREGGYYRAERPNRDTIALFCHFGAGAMLLSHLWGVSPMVVWHGFLARTSSITTLMTEERREGIASFRMLAYGETPHLYVKGEEPSFSGRFCECFNDDTRHD